MVKLVIITINQYTFECENMINGIVTTALVPVIKKFNSQPNFPAIRQQGVTKTMSILSECMKMNLR